MYSLLLLSISSLLHITTCTVYTVTPDDHYYPNTTCHHCHNLQHYLLNITKYFTSNTQLLFLPGLHHLHTDLIIQNVRNISLIGSKVKVHSSTLKTIIQGNFSAILISNVSKLTISNLIINCKNTNIFTLSGWVPLTIKDCSFVLLHHLEVYQVVSKWARYVYALKATNIMGNSNFSHVTCYSGNINLFYNETLTDKKHHSLTINYCMVKGINLNMLQNSYLVKLMVINMKVQHNIYFNSESFITAKSLGRNEVLIMNCQFVSNAYTSYLFLFSGRSEGSVQFSNCQFHNNNVILEVLGLSAPIFIDVPDRITIEFNNCNFQGNEAKILQIQGETDNPANVVIRNTNYSNINAFSFVTTINNFISLLHTTLTLTDSVIFNNLSNFQNIIYFEGNSTITIAGTVKFSNNRVDVLIDLQNYISFQYIMIKVNSSLTIGHNEVKAFFHTSSYIMDPQPYCFFQYFTISTSKIEMKKENFQIEFYNNSCELSHVELIDYYMPTSRCYWTLNSSYQNIIPQEVNDYYIQYANNTNSCKRLQIIEHSSLCLCANKFDPDHDCYINDLGHLYPGQTFTKSFHLYNHKVPIANAVVDTDVTEEYTKPCSVLDSNEYRQYINKNCTKLHYTIGFPTDNWCELFIKISPNPSAYNLLNVFYIRQIPCPTGFIKIDKRCQCDPVLIQYGITNCNINDQTILRPANSWISAKTHNNSYTYHISLHCPFHYCLPHSSHLNFSTPNSHCQFNRSGLLCGHCQQGLSSVLSSLHCQHCSSIYLLIIIPIAIAGIVLVLLLFVFNLTVTDGTINGFVFYANIISIITPVFFTEIKYFTPAYTFISIANLDLGIQTCFYNGMDDYAKMWLQLAFPFYLIFIATLIIITSRYSTTIQRLTARRALPVLATLFLLSYTKILRIVSSVLFFYSTITHLPSKHTTLVWSVDANIPLFGVRFTILFIVCLILFLILVPFNIILLFTRTLSRFRFINKFKPLLDAYQGPYKDKYYYWTGLQLMIRAVFFGISSLNRNTNLTISIILLCILVGMHGIIQPFKTMYKNYQELVLTLNLQALYAISLYHQDGNNLTTITIMISMAAIQFTFIITYHMITYVCGGVIRNKMQLSVNAFTRWITRLHKKSQPQHFQLEDNIRDNILEVAFKYHEFREPLLDQDQ